MQEVCPLFKRKKREKAISLALGIEASIIESPYAMCSNPASFNDKKTRFFIISLSSQSMDFFLY